MPLISGTAFLVAAGSAAVAFPAGAVGAQTSVVAQASAAHASAYSQTITVTSLSDAGAGSLRAAINTADAAPAGNSSFISFGVNGTEPEQ